MKVKNNLANDRGNLITFVVEYSELFPESAASGKTTGVFSDVGNIAACSKVFAALTVKLQKDD